MSALLFFDIDGTLITLGDEHRMPESTKEALYQAKENGHKLIINTGRVKTAIDRELLEFGFDGYVCGCGTYVEYHGEELFHQELPKTQCREYAKALHDFGYETVYEGKNRLFTDGRRIPNTFVGFIYNYFSQNVELPIEDYTHEDLLFDKFTTNQMPESDVAAFEAMFGDKFHLIPHGNDVIELIPGECSKATGIELLRQSLEIPMEDCYAFGDSINDMEMLRYVPHSVGMGNAVQEVLDMVEYQTTDISQDGIANALKHYGLIK